MSETAKESNNDREEKKPIIVRNSTDLQRLKLEKLMKNPEKPVLIPEKPKEKGIPTVPDFVRNVMGSSAGAGSGEFHVYRHLRRKEYARQKFMKEKAEKERLEDEYHQKLEENRKRADERTAKKRQKRLKKKQKQKVKSKKTKLDKSSSEEESESESSDKESSDKESACNSTEHSEIEQKCDVQPENVEKNCCVDVLSNTKNNETENEHKNEENESGNSMNADDADKR